MTRWVLAALAGAFLNCVGLDEALAAEPPDIVKLKNGGMIRGTIQEYVPGDHVTITLPNGEERRIAGEEVAEAGPAPAREAAPAPVADPQPAAPAKRSRAIATVKEDQAPVHFQHEGDEPVAFHVRTGTQEAQVSGWTTNATAWGGTVTADAYEQICTAPCTAEVQKGTHKLALSRSEGKPVGVEQLVTIDGPATLNGTYTSYSGMRTAGWIMVVAGGATLLLGPLAAMSSTTSCGYNETCEPYDTGLAIGTAVAGGVVMITGFVFAFKKDVATVTVQPGVEAARSHRNVAYEPAPRGTPFGLTGALKF